MSQPWAFLALATVLALSTVSVLVWRKKRRTYKKVGKVSKLFFYPVKSLKGIEVSEGTCTRQGFKVNGLTDRTFMVVNEEGILVSQRDEPTLVLLTPRIENNNLIITAPNGDSLTVEIKDHISANDKTRLCTIFTDETEAVECGVEATSFFQKYLNRNDVHFVRHFPNLPNRKFTKNNKFFHQSRKANPITFQDLGALHICSEASIMDLNSKLEEQKVSFKNFRPNILVNDCEPYDEDMWECIKFSSGAEANQIMMTTRCILTTNNPETAELSKKEPLVTLRRFRIVADPEVKKKTGSVPCFGVTYSVDKSGNISVGEDIFADCRPKTEMVAK